jgi:hypothetical protein
MRNRVAYLGENEPTIEVKENVSEEGLRNDYTEYLPLSVPPVREELKMPHFLTLNKKPGN